MAKSVAQKLISNHLVSGEMKSGEEVAIKIDQALMQDATGTMVMLELEAMGCKEVKTEVAVQYVDHNLLETDFKNADDHVFLQSACERFGIWFSPPGNGVSHPVHQERVGVPGKTLLGSDSHTCAAGALGMLAIGAGGLEVALAMMGHPFYLAMPTIVGVKLEGKLQPWVSAKDIILEMLRRRHVDGGVSKIFEYYGPGLDKLSAMDRHVIANMGAELGATASVFPSDKGIERFLVSQGRGKDFVEICADKGARYDDHEEIDLDKLEPLISCPSSPGNVVPVKEVAGKEIYQAMIGSSANPGLRDFAVPALMLDGKRVHPRVSFDINPTSRQILEDMIKTSILGKFVKAGARIHQTGCNGCIGMGQAPATGKISLRTVPRNFPGRSGTKEDSVYLCSPETAAASAITGVITDPRTLGIDYPNFIEPTTISINTNMLLAPKKDKLGSPLAFAPNIKPLPKFDKLENTMLGPVLLKMGDNISTDEILPAGAKVLPLRSNIPEIAKYAFSPVDENYYQRAIKFQNTGSFVVAGSNYGQGSSREHAAIAPRFLGLRAVLAMGYARIHRENLLNFGIMPLVFEQRADLESITQGDELEIADVRVKVECENSLEVKNRTKNTKFVMRLNFTKRERDMLLVGGLIN